MARPAVRGVEAAQAVRRKRASSGTRRHSEAVTEPSGRLLARGMVVYDHLAHRTGRVDRVDHDGSIHLADRTATTHWRADPTYALALEPLETPNELVFAFEGGVPSVWRERLRALGDAEQALALCRGIRTGPSRGRSERTEQGELVSMPVSSRELERAHEAALGPCRRDYFESVVDEAARLPRSLQLVSGGLRVVLPQSSWLLDRLVLDRTVRGEHSREWLQPTPLVRTDASSQSPYRAEEEGVLAWALSEILRIERGERLQPVDPLRCGELRTRLWAVFRASVVAHASRRLDAEEAWIDPETLPDEVFERLLEHLHGEPRAPASVGRLRERVEGATDLGPTSQLIRCALYDVLDALRRRGTFSAPRHPSFDLAVHEGAVGRPADSPSAATLDRDLGFVELRRWLADTGPGEQEPHRHARARQLLHAIRRAFARGLAELHEREPVAYRTVLLDFMSLLSRPQIAAFTGINYNTFRWWYPRSGGRETRPPRYIRELLPPELATFVDQFGRVFPILQLGLLPRQGEIDALAGSEEARRALGELFTHAPLDERGEFWGEAAMRRAAVELGQTVEAFISQTLFPFLTSVVELRRKQSFDRGGHTDTPSEGLRQDRDMAAMALLILGAPDGRGLTQALHAAGERESRRQLARDFPLGVNDLLDLELGRRWARPEELAALERGLGHEGPAAVAGLRPLLLQEVPDFATILEGAP